MLDLLSAATRERSTLLGSTETPRDGRFVLYWMHHAMRDHDNPALDAAIEIANHLQQPVLVYQGLGGKHRYDSDRHHYFILQAARDIAQALARRNIAYQFFLPSKANIRSPLPHLIDQASACVFEHMPVAPFTRWQPKLAAASLAPIVRTDARCIAPMTLERVPVDRAFRFRDALKTEYEQRIASGWRDADYATTALATQQIFEPFDVSQVSDAQMLAHISRLPIDHSVGPIADTAGGTAAGYARWQQFLRSGLNHYHRRRNDAAQTQPPGVSRMSAYLHYGQVSAFRLAADTRQHAGGGSDKYLEELTIWRELAHHYCARTRDADSVDALPKWARETLTEHAHDPRSPRYSLYDLQHANTDSPLWNAAQQSLLAHGELHNNLRMTWAKAIPLWRDSPQAALATLLDLNHRYALDGNDPASYGGLLWALGLFDRPFTPEAPVLGTVRPRSVSAHAKRLDMQAYTHHVQRTQGRRLSIAVIGAGISGLSAAATLRHHNHDVTVFEKSRGPGGRTATRRNADGFVDHGAQYFTSRDPRLTRHLSSLQQDQIIEPWPQTVAGATPDSTQSASTRWRGIGGMNALCKFLAREVTIRSNERVVSLAREHGQWQLRSTMPGGETLSAAFDVVIVSAPAAQAAELLAPVHASFAQRAANVTYSPCWALMLQTPLADTAPDWDAAKISTGPLAWLAHRGGTTTRQWIAHASVDWSTEHVELTAEQACTQLQRAFADYIAPMAETISSASVHRWRYARVQNPLRCDALFDPDAGIGACGDWCADGSRVESAYLSGQAIAGRVLGAVAAQFELQ
ncbi:MAG: FAD-dependent oxidoreductase [Pseudomonadota bacterium]